MNPVRRALRRVPGEVYVLAIVAAITRFVALSNPRAIVFDEVYFREYALHYTSGTYYFDLHPPLGKMLLGLWAAIAGVDATAFDKDPAVAMRFLPALAGTALILVVYLLIRQLSGSRRVATLGAGLLLLDNALLVESRLILLDSMLLLFGISSLTLALAARKRTGRSAWLLFAASAFMAGMAITTKVTGVAALGLIGLIWLVDVIRERRAWRPIVGQLAVLGVLPLLVYVTTFAVHLGVLSKSGPGDAYMTQEFQATLKGNALYRADAKMSFPEKFTDLNDAMRSYQLGLNSGTHPYASKWTSWPITKRGVYFFVAGAGDGKARYIYQIGNPVIWWGTLLGALIVLIGAVARPERLKPYRWPLGLLAVAWMANYLPFSLITRPMFIYHYFFALIFSLSFVVVGLGALTGWINDGDKPFSFPSRWSAIGYWGLLGAALLSFLYFAPLTYALPLTAEGLDARMWLPTWR